MRSLARTSRRRASRTSPVTTWPPTLGATPPCPSSSLTPWTPATRTWSTPSPPRPSETTSVSRWWDQYINISPVESSSLVPWSHTRLTLAHLSICFDEGVIMKIVPGEEVAEAWWGLQSERTRQYQDPHLLLPVRGGLETCQRWWWVIWYMIYDMKQWDISIKAPSGCKFRKWNKLAKKNSQDFPIFMYF